MEGHRTCSDVRLPLALLARSNDLEGGVATLFLALRSSISSGAFLGDFTPAAGTTLLSKRTGRDGVDDALIRKLATANELLGEPTAVESLGVCVDRIRDNLSLRGQEEQLLDEIINCKNLLTFNNVRKGILSQLTIDVAVQSLAERQLCPLCELFNSPIGIGLRSASQGHSTSCSRARLGNGTSSNRDGSAG